MFCKRCGHYKDVCTCTKYFINRQKVDRKQWENDFSDGVHCVYVNGKLIERLSYKDEDWHGLIIMQGETQIWVDKVDVGDFGDILKEKGKLWFVVTFGQTPEQMWAESPKTLDQFLRGRKSND